MPFRDHFRPPVSQLTTWEAVHGQWPAMIVLRLFGLLPAGFVAEPRIHLGSHFEIDVSTYERDAARPPATTVDAGRPATAVWAPPRPTLTIETDVTDEYEYEVRVYDTAVRRRLVAAVELVSPANKDRPEKRRAFVAKTAALLRHGVSVSIVDLVTVRHFNLYADLLDLLGTADPSFVPPPSVYAATLRRRQGDRPAVDTWAYPLVVGEPLPTLPLWLTEEQSVSLDLEASYEDTCRVLHIP